MQEELDLIIRNGTLYDGRGTPGIKADIAVKDGLIRGVGAIEGSAKEEIDATGKIVTPGFVDIHTHYDGQVTWGNRLSPSSVHGVTTVVMGNCGVGFAPCKADDHEMLISLMEGVEDIPGVVLNEGLKWDWETLPEFLDNLDGKAYDMDFAAQVTHAPLRVYVMGKRGADREDATDEDIALMAQIAKEGVEAGALGFTTSRTINHRTSKGEPTPTLTASKKELVGIAKGLQQAGKGVLQLVSDFSNLEEEIDLMRSMAAESGRPLSVSLAQSDRQPLSYQKVLKEIEKAQADGLSMTAQVCGRAVGIVMGLDTSLCPLSLSETYRNLSDEDMKHRISQLSDDRVRQKIISEVESSEHPSRRMVLNFPKMFILRNPPQYEQSEDQSLAQLAIDSGRHPLEIAMDAMVEDQGKGMLYMAFLNYALGNLEPSLEMMKHPHTVMGLADGGAHVGLICDASFPTSMLSHWTRDRTRGEKLSIEYAIQCYTKDSAEVVGLYDRGILDVGYKADINIIDYDNLNLHRPEIVRDLPSGGKRLHQLADGYDATIVSGVITYKKGIATEALPGRLIRGAKSKPTVVAD
ncbi:MAG: N-acyl-D-aspartate/D-glutamate deacylase [Candidatus Azotimanducaceae bacterium]|jgi:N-acyl-D-aspartate/D-glutamate deacylase